MCKMLQSRLLWKGFEGCIEHQIDFLAVVIVHQKYNFSVGIQEVNLESCCWPINTKKWCDDCAIQRHLKKYFTISNCKTDTVFVITTT